MIGRTHDRTIQPICQLSYDFGRLLKEKGIDRAYAGRNMTDYMVDGQYGCMICLMNGYDSIHS